MHDGNDYVEALRADTTDEEAEIIIVSAAIESQIAELEPDERAMFLEEYGLSEVRTKPTDPRFVPVAQPDHLLYRG